MSVLRSVWYRTKCTVSFRCPEKKTTLPDVMIRTCDGFDTLDFSGSCSFLYLLLASGNLKCFSFCSWYTRCHLIWRQLSTKGLFILRDRAAWVIGQSGKSYISIFPERWPNKNRYEWFALLTNRSRRFRREVWTGLKRLNLQKGDHRKAYNTVTIVVDEFKAVVSRGRYSGIVWLKASRLIIALYGA